MTEPHQPKHSQLLDVLNGIFASLLKGDFGPALAFIVVTGFAGLAVLKALEGYLGGWLRMLIRLDLVAVAAAFPALLVTVAVGVWRKVRDNDTHTEGRKHARFFRRLGSALLLLLGLFAGIALGMWGYRQWQSHNTGEDPISDEALLREWGYPEDLIVYQDQLDSLKLGPHVTTLRWLTADLRKLDVEGVSIQGLEAVSPLLEELTISGTAVRKLPRLPSSLEVLNLGGSRVNELKGLPQWLRTLDLENVTPEASVLLPDTVEMLTVSKGVEDWLARWPARLENLTLINTPIKDLSGLPAGVRRIEIKNPATEALDLTTLPERLEELVLDEITVETLGPLPEGLRSLDLEDSSVGDLCTSVGSDGEARAEDGSTVPNPAYRLGALRELRLVKVETGRFCGLPEGLVSFDFMPSDSIGDLATDDLPSSIRSLKITWQPSQRLQDLPPLLESLTIRWAGVAELGPLPDYVRKLELSQTSITGFLGGVPPSLSHLTMRGCSSLDVADLPESLRSFDVQGCNLSHLPALTPGLKSLNVSRTCIASLDDLPQKLRTLDISNTRIHSLKDLPPYLESLTLSEGQVDTLEGMRESVRELRFVEGIDVPCGESSDREE